jgi:lysozyme
MSINPKVFDIYHGDTVTSFDHAHAAGYLGVIHKATQGLTDTDAKYAERRPLAVAAGLLWGAYHFNTGAPIRAQVGHFLQAAKPDDKTLMALDFEDYSVSEMSLSQCIEFLGALDEATGRASWLYSGNRLKQLIVGASQTDRDFLAGHPLWGCEYGPRWRNEDVNGNPLPWDKPTLWQFTGDGVGPHPHSVMGIEPPTDINSFEGTDEKLVQLWK